MSDNGKIDEFKSFVKVNPFLVDFVKDGSKTWQDMYELYDIYGSDTEAWNKFLKATKKDNSTKNNIGFNDIVKMVKNMDVDKVQEGITSLQKTLALFGDLFVNNNSSNSSSNNNYNPRPLYRRFED